MIEQFSTELLIDALIHRIPADEDQRHRALVESLGNFQDEVLGIGIKDGILN